MELTSGILSRIDYLRAVEVVVEFLRTAGVSDVLVAYGFGCDCPDEQLYQDVPMPLDRLLPFMAEARHNLEMLSAQFVDGSIRIECADGGCGGYLLAKYLNARVATPEGLSLTQTVLESACEDYWALWEAKAKRTGHAPPT